MKIEQRSHRRRALRHVVRLPCQAVRERDFTLVGDVAIDLSADGMLLRTRRNVLTGEPVLVSFFEPLAARWYDVEATVARVIHRRRQSDAERCIALEFHSLDATDRASLWNLLATRPLVPPATAPIAR